MENIGLLLSGGGARAAYQVGVMVAIQEMLGNPEKTPFSVYGGTSAGAINASFLVQHSDNWTDGVDRLKRVWESLHTQDVYESDWSKLYNTAKPWMKMLGVPLWGGTPTPPKSLLDNSPLKRMLENTLQPELWSKRIRDGDVKGLAITAFDYTTGVHTTFYDTTNSETQPWSRHQRVSVNTEIRREHVFASAALPLIFPSVEILGREFGDGAMRQTAPLSPLIKLGASRLLVVGVNNKPESDVSVQSVAVSPATILGHAMASIFLDQLGADVERIERLNELIRAVGENSKVTLNGLKSVEMLVIRPSQRLDVLAAQAVGALPKSIQKVMGVLGVKHGHGGGLASYILFEPEFTTKLMEMGFEDAKRQKDELLRFFDRSPKSRPRPR
jgi:NTE family protein